MSSDKSACFDSDKCKHVICTVTQSFLNGLATQEDQDKVTHLPSQLPWSEGHKTQTLSPQNMPGARAPDETGLQHWMDQTHDSNRVLTNSRGKVELLFPHSGVDMM